ncbi:MAG: TonB-dependent receptor, partial [Candidatus Eisenbacteria bacterium]
RKWKQHTFKTGIEARYNRVQNLTIVRPNNENAGLPGGVRSDYVNYNPEGAYYMQDRWEYEGLVLNAGLRYDLFTPGDQVSTRDLPSGKRYKEQLSPRLGIAYPISDKDVLSFHYGWTYQTPGHNFVFENRGLSSSVAIRGNPDLQPETNIAYQAAVQHLFTRDVSGQFAVFFKDIKPDLDLRESGLRELARLRGQHHEELQPQVLDRDQLHLPDRDRCGVGSAAGAAVHHGQRTLPADLRAAARLGPAQHADDPGRRARSGPLGVPVPVAVRVGLPVHAHLPERPQAGSGSRQLASSAVQLDPHRRR